MKELPDELAAKLASGVTTLCWCWRLKRRDGVVQGFTDHDRDLVFDDTTFEAAAGFTASEMRDSVGLSVDNLEVMGALTSERLAEADLAAGLYDDARVEIFRVDWQAPENRILMRTGSLGEVRRAGIGFTAEVRGLAHYLQQPKGRVFQYTCDADLGDRRCRVVLSNPAFTAAGMIEIVKSPRRFTVSGLDEFASGWFARGLLTFTSGPAAGQKVEVKAHVRSPEKVEIELWEEPRGALVATQTFSVQAGCDKTLATCRDKFANAVNFRGFPQMPGNDFVAAFAPRRAGKK